jgi:uncharacterized protein (DUF1778 family)
MATKKIVRRSSSPRPDRQSKKRSGYLNQSLRLTVADNKLLREAAALDGCSINFWAVRALVAASKVRIAKEKRNSTLKASEPIG